MDEEAKNAAFRELGVLSSLNHSKYFDLLLLIGCNKKISFLFSQKKEHGGVFIAGMEDFS